MTESARYTTRLNDAVVLSLESRRCEEMAVLIKKQGGVPVVAPSMREVPLADQRAALQFAAELLAGRCDVLILLTGVGLTALMKAMEIQHERGALVAALGHVSLVCRGPKPLSVLREWGLSAAVVAPEPNTTATLLAEIERAQLNLKGKRVYIQEYGASAAGLAVALQQQGAEAQTVPIYAWQLPVDQGPLEHAVTLLAERKCQAMVLTSGQQLRHLALVAERLKLWEQVLSALRDHVVIASIGPVTTEALAEYGLNPDLEPSHPKMGRLVSELSAQWPKLSLKNTAHR